MSSPPPPPPPETSTSEVKPRIGTLHSAETTAAASGSSSSAAPVVMGSTLRKAEPAAKPKLLFKPTVPVRRKKEE